MPKLNSAITGFQNLSFVCLTILESSKLALLKLENSGLGRTEKRISESLTRVQEVVVQTRNRNAAAGILLRRFRRHLSLGRPDADPHGIQTDKGGDVL